MLLKNFAAAYQSLREACAISGPCTSTRTRSVFHCSSYLSQLTVVVAYKTNQVVLLGGHWANWSIVVSKQTNQVVFLGGHWANLPVVVANETNQVVLLGGHWANWPVAVSKQTNSVAVVLSGHWAHSVVKLIQLLWWATKLIIQISIIHATVTKVSLAQSVSELHCN